MALPTISYTDIAKIPFPERQTLRSSPLADIFASMLTPGQQAALFPSYATQTFTTALPSTQRTINRSGIPPAYGPAAATQARTVTGGTNSEREKLQKELVPGGLVPGPDGKPMRVPDLAVETRAKDIGNGLHLEPKKRMAIVQKAIEDQLRSEGYNAKDIKAVAAAFTGQVSRESNFNPTANHDNGTGYGIYGARLDRRDNMFAWLDENGYAKDSLVGQAKYMAHEANTKFSGLMGTLADMDGTQVGEMAHEVMTQFEKPKASVAGAAERIAAAGEAYNLDLSDVETDGTVTAELKTAYDLSPEQIKVAAGETASPLAAVNADGSLKPIDDPLAYLMERNPNGANLKDVDPKLLKATAEGIQQYERLHPEHKVEIFGDESGFRTSGSTANHGAQPDDGMGAALDTLIINRETGKQLRNHAIRNYTGQSGSAGETGPRYLELHSMIQLANDYYNPNEGALRTGAGFSGGADAGDFMHIDQRTSAGMGGFSWEEGLTAQQMRNFGITENLALGDKETRTKTASQLFSVNDQGEYINTPVKVGTKDGVQTIATAPIVKQQPAPSPEAATVQPRPVANSASLSGTVMGWGYNAAAGGAEITDPSYIVSENGNKLTRVAETGPEKVEMKITPRNRADQFGPPMQPPPQIAEPAVSAGQGDDQKMKMTDPSSMAMGPQVGSSRPGTAMVDVGHQQLGLTSRIAYSQSKFVSPFNQAAVAGDTGMTYVTRGIG